MNQFFPFIRSHLVLTLGLALTPVVLGGCNIFHTSSTPGSDDRILSRARACFDQGDMQCAKDNYAKLSTSSADERITEETYLTMNELNVTWATFMEAFIPSGGSFKIGNFITKVGQKFATNAGEATRLTLFSAFKNTGDVSNERLRGLLRFLTSTLLMAEILAEDATDGNYTTADLVKDPTSCANAAKDSASASATSPYCALYTACNKPTGKKISTGTSIGTDNDLTQATTAQMSGDPTLYMLFAAMVQVINGVNLISGSGSSSSSAVLSSAVTFVNQFSSILLSSYTATAQDTVTSTSFDSPCFRYILQTSLF